MTHFRPKSSKGLDIPMDEIYVVLFGSRAGYVEAGHQSRVYFGELAVKPSVRREYQLLLGCCGRSQWSYK